MLAVFDLDGTLLNGDSTSLWLRDRFWRSPPRLIAALLALPLAMPMVLIPRFRRVGASILIWIASVGLDQRALELSFRRFADAFVAGTLPLAWRVRGLAVLDDHRANKVEIVIVTAAPALLARALAASLDGPIIVLGSSLKRRAGGWIADLHCRHEAKRQVLAEAGYGTCWAFAYTDSLDDLPLLLAADHPVLVQDQRHAGRLARRASPARVELQTW